MEFKNAEIPHEWCVRNYLTGLKLTFSEPCLKTAEGKLVFKPRDRGYKSTRKGVELQILEYTIILKIIYVKCGNGKWYKLLIQNSHGTRTDAKDCLTERLRKRIPSHPNEK